MYDQGLTGCIVTANSKGEVTPLFLKDLQDEDGKIAPRLVNIHSEFVQLCFQNLYYLEEADYDLAKSYVKNPSDYDFTKILKEA